MQQFADFDSLLAAIRKRKGDAPGVVVAIEGHSTSGKTYMSKDLAKRLGGVAVGTDSYSRDGPKTATYLQRMDLDRLARDVDRLARAGPVIVEGICLRDTLGALRVAPTAFVYLKVMTVAGLWRDELENYLEDGEPAGSWTDRQSVDYHLREKPHERADFIFVRVEDLPPLE